nr:SGNH/GDSL hydrolase family protein [Gemmatimonadota bacterium]
MAEGKGKQKQKRSPPAETARPPLSRRKAIAFLAVTLSLPFVLFAILEMGLRAADYGGDMPAFEAAASSPSLRVPSSRLGRRYFPREQYPPSPPGDLFLASKPANSMRIFVLGESSTAGFPYSANGTFSRLLRDVLTDVLPDDTVEVVNLGMAATNSYTIADLADEVVAEHPDAVMIYGGHNEYYGALGAGSTESLGSFPGIVRIYLKLQHLKTFLLLRNASNAVVSLFG